MTSVGDDLTATRTAGIRVGRVGAVPVYLRASWFAVAAGITVLYAPVVRGAVLVAPGAAYLVSFSFAVLLLLSVFIHELAHAWAASLTGTPASHIVLDLWGGHTAFSAESADPWRSIGVSVVGPASNAVIALAAELMLHGSLAVDQAGMGGQGVDRLDVTRLLLQATARANLLVAVFNALPGLPLDGGRVLEAVLWWATGDRHTGTRAAGWSGRVLAIGAVAWTLITVAGGGLRLTGGIWLLVIAWLLWQGAGQAMAAARWYRQADRAQLNSLMQPAVSVSSTATVADALLTALRAGAQAVVVLDIYGRPAAVVDERAAAGVPPGRTDQVRAIVVAETLSEGAVLQAGLAGEELIQRLQDSPSARYAVLDPKEQVIGVLDWEAVATFIGA